MSKFITVTLDNDERITISLDDISCISPREDGRANIHRKTSFEIWRTNNYYSEVIDRLDCANLLV